MKINGKYEINLPPHRERLTVWETEAGWERARLDSMHDHLGAGDVVYYAGAELGEMPALCALWGASVVNIEPNHTAWPTIKYIWEANNLPPPLFNFAGFATNVTSVEPKNPNRELRMSLYKGEGWKLEKDGWPRYCRGAMVEEHGFSELYQEHDGLPQIKIDDMPELYKLPPATALIMDVEGAEFHVLRGAEQMIRHHHPKIWLSLHPEFLINQYKIYGRDVRDWIINKGYTEHFLDYQHEVHLYYEPNGKPMK